MSSVSSVTVSVSASIATAGVTSVTGDANVTDLEVLRCVDDGGGNDMLVNDGNDDRLVDNRDGVVNDMSAAMSVSSVTQIAGVGGGQKASEDGKGEHFEY